MSKFTHVGEATLTSLVGQVAGYVSVCWENVDEAGVFDSTSAGDAVNTAVEGIRDLIHTRLVALLDNAGTASEWNDAIETAIKVLVEQ